MPSLRKLWKNSAIFAALLCAGGQAWALSTPFAPTENSAARLVYAGEAESGGLMLGLHITMQPEWKTYWRYPGDAGVPPKVKTEGSDNLAELEQLWPAPTRYVEEYGLESFGYKDEAVFPLRVIPVDAAQPVALKAQVSYMVCREICIPYEANFMLDIPAGAAADPEEKALVDKFVERIPAASAQEGLTLEETAILQEGEKKYFVVTIASTEKLNQPDVFVDAPAWFRFPKPDVRMLEDGQKAELRFAYEVTVPGKELAGTPLALTVRDGLRVIENTIEVAGEEKNPLSDGIEKNPNGSDSFALILAVAFLGGLILNVMPCVLPVLSLKVLGVLKHGGGLGERGHIRAGFLASAAGIIASFLALGGMVMALRQAGIAAGWGFHFQEPEFLIALVLILMLFAANLWGWFELRLPYWLGGRLGSAGGDGHSLIGHFFTGAFATLMATPCTAPFLGTAVSFALARGGAEILSTFTAMGAGLAFPYLMVAAFPGAVRLLPRPGAWMLKVKALFGFLLLGTALWLVWVLAGQVGDMAAGAVLLLAAAMLVKLALFRKHARLGRPHVLMPLLFVLAALAFYAPHQFGEAPAQHAVAAGEFWRPFDEGRIDGLVKEGKVVFVDITAAWCLTCKANKLLVLDKEDVRAALAAEGVVAMMGDWTNPDPRISAYLEKFGRYGIPFNIVYGPGLPQGKPLPELLSKDAVLSALKEAKGE